MPRKRWIKLWTQELLYGSTCKELTPEERWVWIGCLALAGDSVQPGIVQAAPGVAWTEGQLSAILRVPPQMMAAAINKMVGTDKLQRRDDGTLKVTNWERYQAFDPTVYMQGYRDKLRGSNALQTSNEDPALQDGKQDTPLLYQTRPEGRGGEEDQNKKEQQETEGVLGGTDDGHHRHGLTREEEFLQALATAYERNVGTLSSALASDMRETVTELFGSALPPPLEWAAEAVKEAAVSNVRKWSYIKAILLQWAGTGTRQPRELTRPPPPPAAKRTGTGLVDPKDPDKYGKGKYGHLAHR